MQRSVCRYGASPYLKGSLLERRAVTLRRVKYEVRAPSKAVSKDPTSPFSLELHVRAVPGNLKLSVICILDSHCSQII